MALNGRVRRLERVAGDRPAAPCPDCGGPAGWKPLFDVVGGDGHSLLDACTRCGLALYAERPVFALPPGRGQKHYGANVDWRAV